MPRLRITVALLLAPCAAFGWVAASTARAATVLEPGFSVTEVVRGLSQPTALAYAPDGRLFIAEKTGRIRVFEKGALRSEPFAQLDVWDFFESGLLGLALDPDFSNNGFVYAFATVAADEQNIIRLRDDHGHGVDETVIRDHIPSAGTFHNGGCLRFGPDGLLYFSVGDNGHRENAQDLTTLAGKINRIDRDGGTPDSNPFKTVNGAPRMAFALGFRNPFRFCVAPDGRLFVMDVGSDGAERREELNLVHAGDNCGWPLVEGLSDDPAVAAYVKPLYTYHDEGASPTGVIFYAGGSFPAAYSGNLFHLDYTLNRLFRVRLEGDRVVGHDLFAQGEGGPVDLTVAPDGSLAYCELIGGRVMRIVYDPDGTLDGQQPPPPPQSLCGLNIPPLFALAALTLTRTLAHARRKPVRQT